MRNLSKILFFLLLISFVPAKKIVIKMATLAPEGTEWHETLLEMGQQWKQATNGEVELRIYHSGVVGDERDMIRKMRIGQIHAAAVSTEGLSDICPSVFAFIIPMLFDDYSDVDWIRERISDELETEIEENGFILLNWVDVGWAHWFTRKPMLLPEDLEDMRIWVWAGDFRTAELWKKAGYEPISLASIDVLSGLQTGLIDALATSPLVAASMQWFGPAPYMLDMKWGLITGGIVIDKRLWSRIKPEHQTKLLQIAHEISASHQKTSRYTGNKAIEAMQQIEHSPIKVHHQTPDEKQKWLELTQSFYPEIRGSLIPEKIFDKVIELKAEKEALNKFQE